MSRRIFPMVVIIAVTVSPAMADPYADAAHRLPDWPIIFQKSLHPIPQDRLDVLLSQPILHHVFDVYAGQNDALAAAAQDTQPLSVGAGYSTDLGAAELFRNSVPASAPDAREFAAAITSVDAVALRLQVDLAALKPGEEVYVIDPTGPRALGAYTAQDHLEGGRWLPTVEGPTAVLLVRGPAGVRPELRLVGVSHFYRQLEDVKELACNINAACLTDPQLLNATSAVGIIVRTTVSGDSGVCSGTLINNPDTPQFEPYYITANHCIPGAISAQQADIIFDFRTGTCAQTTPPPLSTLPRSDVLQVLATDAALDMTLVLLSEVPSGPFGRTYVGWDTRTPNINEDVVGIHHPDAKYMRVSFGHITAINVPGFGSLPYVNQTEVKWDQGVTEGGSSGSCLLFEDNARLMGTLSNGPVHSCLDTSRNKDRYGSFRVFFPQVAPYLTTGGVGVPSIQLSESSHSFGAQPTPWTFEIWNGDPGSTLTFAITGVPAWATLSRTTGQSTGPDDREAVTVTVTPDLLAPGLNSATLQVTAPGASPRTIVITAMGPKIGGCSAGAPGASRVIWSDLLFTTGCLLVLLAGHRRYRGVAVSKGSPGSRSPQ